MSGRQKPQPEGSMLLTECLFTHNKTRDANRTWGTHLPLWETESRYWALLAQHLLWGCWRKSGCLGKPLFPDSKLICCLHLPLSEPMKGHDVEYREGLVVWRDWPAATCHTYFLSQQQAKKFPCVFLLSLFFESEQIDVTGSSALAEWPLMNKKNWGEGVCVLYVCDMVRVTVQKGIRWSG